MKKQYFAWKDGTKELAEITAKEFRAICEQNKRCPPKERSYFARVPGITEDDTYYFIQCSYEEYKKSAAESQARHRKLCREKTLKENGLWNDPISFEQPAGDSIRSGGNLHDVIADSSASFEETLVSNIALEAALAHLTDAEREIVRMLYLENSERASEAEIAARMGIPQRTLNNRKQKILSKLKKYLA